MNNSTINNGLLVYDSGPIALEKLKLLLIKILFKGNQPETKNIFLLIALNKEMLLYKIWDICISLQTVTESRRHIYGVWNTSNLTLAITGRTCELRQSTENNFIFVHCLCIAIMTLGDLVILYILVHYLLGDKYF